jgi:YfiH family protein
VAVVRAEGPSAPCQEADAVLSERPGLAACVAVADCVPVLLAREDGRAVAAVHAGWKGTLAGAAAAGLQALAATGAEAAAVRVVVGPSIGPCCYEVSEELAARFAAAFGRAVVVPGPRGPHLDLPAANELALRQLGVTRVERLRRCTACEPERFFSHRRDAGRTGRMVAFVAPRAISTGRAVP